MNSNGIITAPVRIKEDIATVLGVASADLGYLCSNLHGNTNKYSRKKPVIIEGVDVNLTQPTDWWKGENLQCGLRIPYRKAITSCINDYFDGSMRWGYDAPEPNKKYPARALDFDGYYHYAINPISTEGFPDTIWLEAGYGKWILRFSLDIATEGDEYNLGLTDIDIRQITGASEKITDWYPGLIFRKTNGNDYFAVTTDGNLASGSFDIEIEGAKERLTGSWKIIPFLSTIPVDTYNGDDKEGYYISADVDPLVVTIRGSDELKYGLMSAYWIGDPTEKTIGYQGWIINNETREVTVDVTLFIYSTSDPGLTPDQDGNSENERSLNIGKMTVLAESSVDFGSNDNTSYTDKFDPIKLISYRPEKTYWAGVSVDGGSVVEWWQLEELAPDGEGDLDGDGVVD